MLKMLIADDEKTIRESIRSVIPWEELDIRIVGLAKNGSEAYEMMLDENPDIVLTDICMPGFSGLELIAQAFRSSPQTEFIILSGYSEFEYARKAMQYGVKHYLLKPCAPEELVRVVQDVKNDYNTRILRKVQQFFLDYAKLSGADSQASYVETYFAKETDATLQKMILGTAASNGISLPCHSGPNEEAAGNERLQLQKSVVDEVISYVQSNISNPNISLKWLAENLVYMNADYLGKLFTKQTGIKFSTFINNVRINAAKQLMQKDPTSHVCEIAEAIGLGNSPQYFNQLFKKATGMTLLSYAEKLTSRHSG